MNPTDIKWRPIEQAPRDGTRVLLWDGVEFGFASWEGVRGRMQWFGDEGQEYEPTHFALLVPPRGDRP